MGLKKELIKTNASVFMMIVFPVCLFLTGCKTTQIVMPQAVLPASKVEENISAYAGMTKEEALDVVRNRFSDFVEVDGTFRQEKLEITDERFYRHSSFERFTYTGEAYVTRTRARTVAFTWASVVNVAVVQNTKRGEITGYSIRIGYYVTRQGRPRPTNTGFTSFHANDTASLWEMMAALTSLCENAYLSMGTPKIIESPPPLTPLYNIPKIDRPKSTDHAIVYGKVDLQAPVSLNARIHLAEISATDTIRHTTWVNNDGYYFVPNLPVASEYYLEKIYLFRNSRPIGSFSYPFVTFGREKDSQLINIGLQKISIDDAGYIERSAVLPFNSPDDEISHGLFSFTTLGAWRRVYKNELKNMPKDDV